MLLMVSVQNMEEAKQALKGNADIVDVKNLQEALVGSAHPWLVKEVRDYVPQETHASVTLGVVPNQVGTVAMAVYSAGLLNATSVKVGFMKTEYQMAVDILLASKEALNGTETKLIGSLFADNELYDGLDPNKMVDLAKDGGCDGFLIDTLTKDGRNLFDFMSEEVLTNFVYQGKSMGISTALSGHLRLDNLDELARINPDIVGVRGAVCSKGERDNSVYWEAVANFRKELNLRESGEIAVRDLDDSANSINGDEWIVIDGTGKSCASIILELSEQVERDTLSFVEVVMPDVLNTYDVIVWAQKGGHKVISQRKENNGSVRILVQPR
ncbi:MAG: hypothetical protein FI718_02260 [SAR202 cluster bacterium]|nr:hypothetical protein [SAR202 cluster bacterium]|tara:strand:- start:227 stop:1207 length:981 start_codon:yes stop_codon:yes gene_type:complete